MAAQTLEARLYQADGATRIRDLKQRRDLSVMEEHNGVGWGELAVPVTDASGIAFDQVVKVTYTGTIVSGFVIEEIGRIHAAADGGFWLSIAGRGLLSWLEDGVVYPQSGYLSSYMATERPFNFAGAGGSFSTRVTWVRPLGFKVKDTPTSDYRYGYPKGWPDRSAYWIWKTNPLSNAADGAVNWFRSTFTTTTVKKLRFFVTADNYFDFYVDGALVLATSDLPGEGATWRRVAARTLTIQPGIHTVAARVTNGRNGSISAKAGFLATITNVDSKGKPTTVIRHTDKTAWYVTSTEPTWFASEVIETLVQEHRARAAAAGQVSRMNYFTIGWAATTDSSSRSWTTAFAKTIPVGTSYLDVLAEMVDQGVDFWLDAATNTLKAYETRGTDKSAAVLLKVGKNLAEYETKAIGKVSTAALVRSADGFAQRTDTAAATRGRRECYLEFGNTKSETTAGNAASRVLTRIAKNQYSVERISVAVTDDTRPFLDYGVGDRVTTRSSTGTKTTARVLSLTLSEASSGGALTAIPQLEVLA